MLDRLDIAEDLGVVARELPAIESLRAFETADHPAPAELIEGLLHQGCKAILGGTSKSNKSWSLLDMGLSVAGGAPWWGKPSRRGKVAYVNFELPAWAMANRISALRSARPEYGGVDDNFFLWNLRGHNTDLTLMRPKLEEVLAPGEFSLVIMDPAYKVLGGRDENSNGEIAGLMNEMERLTQACGAATLIAHHFAKGDSTLKDPADRMSGAGAWARDPDSIIILTPHEEPDAFTVSTRLRNLPRLEEFVVRWRYPLMVPDPSLNPDCLRTNAAARKTCTDGEFLLCAMETPGLPSTTIAEKTAQKFGFSTRTALRYLARLIAAGLVENRQGLHFPATPP